MVDPNVQQQRGVGAFAGREQARHDERAATDVRAAAEARAAHEAVTGAARSGRARPRRVPVSDAPADVPNAPRRAAARTRAAAHPARPPSPPPARAPLAAAVTRDTPGTDLVRYVAALDAVFAWTAARAPHLLVRAAGRGGAGLRRATRGDRPGASAVPRVARPVRGDTPTGAIGPTDAGAISPEVRARAVAVLNAQSRAGLGDRDRRRVGFGSVGSPTERTAAPGRTDDRLEPHGPAGAAAAVDVG
jgi:hypothetical protein